MDNPASLAVSRKLGYVEDGTGGHERRGEFAEQTRLLLTGERFAEYRPSWELRVQGLDGCRHLLGI